jgi:flagellar protein FliL
MAKDKPEADGEGADGEGGAKGFLSKKLIIMVAGGLLVLGAVGGGAYVFLGSSKHGQEEKVVQAPVKPPPAFYDLPELLVNLQAPGGRSAYLKAKIVLEVEDAKLVEQIKPLMPRVMDAFQTYLREMRQSDLEGSAGLYRLREELTRRVNVAVAPSKINAVLFKEIVFQ